ncbi:MAG TPA: fluoride efflux transporter CrcB [Caproiciproducens sp.]|nr:fluoride efflux transporter CrcB [Caproiciproducens sp.]
MKKNTAVAVGGAIGSVVRYLIQMIPVSSGSSQRPLLTMLINITGSFILGFLIILFVKRLPVKAEVRLFFTTGFLGGYTTFSTLCKDTVSLLYSGQILLAAAYLAASLLFGLAAAWLGILAAKKLERRRAA